MTNMHIKIIKDYLSIRQGTEFDLPDFCVLTGKNGSGESHLLQALNKEDVAQICVNEKLIPSETIKYIGFNGLNPQIDDSCDRQQLEQQLQSIWQFFQQLQSQIHIECVQSGQSDQMSWFHNNYMRFGGNPNQNKKYLIAIGHISKKLSKELIYLTEDDIRRNIVFSDLDDLDIFQGQFATIFKAYQIQFDNNRYREYRHNKYDKSVSFYTEDEFIKLNGPKPWVFINQILHEAKLPYIVSNPDNSERDAIFNFRLINQETKTEIKANNLSTGETVLMSLALAIYNTAEKNIKNEIMLIDEPDAALHPEFSKFMLNTLKHHIVDKAGLKVIITTHSPTTVALTDEEYIYEMDKVERIPKKVSKEKALSILCSDIPSLRVSIDKQRVVFVESKYDAENYNKLFNLINKQKHFDFQPIFHPASTHDGSNCHDVTDLINKLKAFSGIYGIIDYDGKNKTTSDIIVLGENGECRYTLENYILDPVFVGLALLRDHLVNNIPIDYNYVDFKNQPSDKQQNLITWVCNE